jgi:hypothetical protein
MLADGLAGRKPDNGREVYNGVVSVSRSDSPSDTVARRARGFGRSQFDALEEGGVADVTFEKTEMWMGKISEERFTPKDEIIHNCHVIPALKQYTRQQRAYVTSAASYQNVLMARV